MSDTPQRWWQWVLMYPTIVIALVAGVPQIYQWVSALTMGLSPFGNVDDALTQQKAWERNLNCLHDIDHIKPTASTNYSIDLVSCPSGDILITLTPLRNPDRQISRWIVTNTLFSEFAESFLTIRAVCTENLVHFELMTESLTVGRNGRADIALLESNCLAVQVQGPT